jgi:hypothetical protein
VLQVELVRVNKSKALSMKYRVEALLRFLVVSQLVMHRPAGITQGHVTVGYS